MTDNIQLKKKVTIRTKASSPEPSTGGGSNGDNGSKAKWYAVALAGFLVLGGGGYYWFQQGEEEPKPVVAVAGTGQSDETAKEETTEGNLNEQNQEGETPTDAATAENPSGDTPSSDTPDGEVPTTPDSKSDAVAPALVSTPASPSASQPVQDKPKENSAQTRPVTGPSNATGTVEEEAKEVIRGKYGNGDIRKRNLGDRYAEIQSLVNEMYRNGQVQ